MNSADDRLRVSRLAKPPTLPQPSPARRGGAAAAPQVVPAPSPKKSGPRGERGRPRLLKGRCLGAGATGAAKSPPGVSEQGAPSHRQVSPPPAGLPALWGRRNVPCCLVGCRVVFVGRCSLPLCWGAAGEALATAAPRLSQRGFRGGGSPAREAHPPLHGAANPSLSLALSRQVGITDHRAGEQLPPKPSSWLEDLRIR